MLGFSGNQPVSWIQCSKLIKLEKYPERFFSQLHLWEVRRNTWGSQTLFLFDTLQFLSGRPSCCSSAHFCVKYSDEVLSWEKLQSTQLCWPFSDSCCLHLIASCSHHLVIQTCFGFLPWEDKNGYHLWLAESYVVLRLQALIVKRERNARVHIPTFSQCLSVFNEVLCGANPSKLTVHPKLWSLWFCCCYSYQGNLFCSFRHTDEHFLSHDI